MDQGLISNRNHIDWAMEVCNLPDGLYAAMPFNLDIDTGVLCLERSLHVVKRLEEAACRYYLEDDLFMTCFPCGAARTPAEHPDEDNGNQQEFFWGHGHLSLITILSTHFTQ
jgi:hypothetical protein